MLPTDYDSRKIFDQFNGLVDSIKYLKKYKNFVFRSDRHLIRGKKFDSRLICQ